jgi:hypothetical protein
MTKQPVTITLSPTQVQAITAALRHNTADCPHLLEQGVRHGCGACRALELWLRLTAVRTPSEGEPKSIP